MKPKIKDSYFCQIKWPQHLKTDCHDYERDKDLEKKKKRETEKERKW